MTSDTKFSDIILPSGTKMSIMDGKAYHAFVAITKYGACKDDILKAAGVMPFIMAEVIQIDGKKVTPEFIVELSINDGMYLSTVINLQMEDLQ